MFGQIIKSITAQKMKFSIKDIFSKRDQIHNFLQFHGREDWMSMMLIESGFLVLIRLEIWSWRIAN